MEPERLWVVEDDDTIGATLVRALEAHGYDVRWLRTGRAALDAIDSLESVDLVLLDLGLPDVDGLEICRQIRQHDAALPIVILTARQSEVDVVVGLDSGAVDYVRKPVGLAELLARLRAHLRQVPAPTVPSVEVGDVRADAASRRAWVDGREVDLRAKEFDLLVMLMTEAGRAVTRERLMSEIWDEHWFGSTKTLDTTMASLRRKLGEGVGERSRITPLRGVGYRFERP
jgi:DNA-binding response OmpR family regulator